MKAFGPILDPWAAGNQKIFFVRFLVQMRTRKSDFVIWEVKLKFANRQRTSQELLIFCGPPKANGPLWQSYVLKIKKKLRSISLISTFNNSNIQILRHVTKLSYCKANKNFNMTSKATADCSNQSQITNSILK